MQGLGRRTFHRCIIIPLFGVPVNQGFSSWTIEEARMDQQVYVVDKGTGTFAEREWHSSHTCGIIGVGVRG